MQRPANKNVRLPGVAYNKSHQSQQVAQTANDILKYMQNKELPKGYPTRYQNSSSMSGNQTSELVTGSSMSGNQTSEQRSGPGTGSSQGNQSRGNQDSSVSSQDPRHDNDKMSSDDQNSSDDDSGGAKPLRNGPVGKLTKENLGQTVESRRTDGGRQQKLDRTDWEDVRDDRWDGVRLRKKLCF